MNGPARPVTLKELAARAGVHPSTVSRVVNNDPVLRVSAETRARIEALLVETDYRPDGVARSLRLRQTFVLAMLIPDITNPLFANIFLGIEEAAGERGYGVILANTAGTAERERAHLRSLQARRVDGLVLASVSLRDPSVRWLREQGIKHVLVNRYSSERDPFVGADDLAGGRMATRHLVALGHRRIAHLAGSAGVSTAVQRRRGYLAALAEAGIAPEPELVVESGYLEATGRRAMERLLRLRRPPTAVFAVNDMAAMGAHAAILASGLRIPEDVAIVGYNDVPLASRLAPPLTTLRVPVRDFGRLSAEMLIEQIQSGRSVRRRVVLQPELIVRGSTVLEHFRREGER
ncbi:MAG TPA: LacI family DNA-binding transcriptional regulator [Candidatus Eisenbacteria bacterium]|nr:LacI family DNA-binding transcriptional regulator [Candidatus Eisenbacteria bacterium]